MKRERERERAWLARSSQSKTELERIAQTPKGHSSVCTSVAVLCVGLCLLGGLRV